MKTLLLSVFMTILISVAYAPIPKQNFCQNNQCLTCIGRYCTTTCRGESCKECPFGDCCDGSKCDICRGEKCCSTEECNNCVIKCLEKCQGKSTCHYDCFQECLPSDKIITVNGNQSYGHSLVSNKNYSPVNVTTIINITNTIENENHIHNPIIVNSTNINNYKAKGGAYHRKKIIISPINNNNEINVNPNIARQNCCEVVHPENCQNIQGQNITLCYTGKHKECSDICFAQHVHIVENKEEKSQCVVIAKKPYFFCGNYVLENCDSCYSCSNAEGLDCIQTSECSERCRNSIISEEFYNKLYRKDE